MLFPSPPAPSHPTLSDYRRSTHVPHALVRALIYSCLDYCNGLFAGLIAVQFARLQTVLRAAARLWVDRPGRAPQQSCLTRSLAHFPQRVTFNLCLMTYNCLHGLTPTYLSQSCVPVAAVTGRSHLRSAGRRPHAVRSANTDCHSWSTGIFLVLRDPDISLLHFRQSLKT